MRIRVSVPARACIVLGLSAALGAAVLACADTDTVTLGYGDARDAGVPSFTPASDGAADDGAASETKRPLALCVSTECPYPTATCSESGQAPRYRCGTDLSTDIMNCGACGNACGMPAGEMNITIACVAGACKAVCHKKYRDCNGIVDDGCEVDSDSDPKNCGGCGLECPAGQKCRGGQCGCPPGTVECGDLCRDLTSDDAHCGACDHDCSAQPVDAGAVPANMTYGCRDSACGQLKCDRRFGFWADCNKDLADGCEVNLTATDELGHYDPNNCGECGKKCAPGASCVFSFTTGYTCLECPKGQVLCGNACVDVDSDPTNCGACGHICASPVRVFANDPGGQPTCDRGRCSYECRPGFADCNGVLEDGCEVELAKDPHHCGSCGNACDNAVGQPCVNGQCAMRECDAGGPVN